MSSHLPFTFTFVVLFIFVPPASPSPPSYKSCNLWNDPTTVAFFLHVCDPSTNTTLAPSFTAQCSIESALRHNPDWEIWVLTNCWNVQDFAKEPFQKSRFQFRYIQVADLFQQDQRMNEWFGSGRWKSGYKYHHLSDALRLSVLQACGATYLDSDIISVRGLSELPSDFVGLEAIEPEEQLNNAVMRVTSTAGKAFVSELIEDFVINFDATRFGWNGPQMLTRVVAAFKMREALDVSVVNPKAFYPVAWGKVHDLFREEVSVDEVLGEGVYGVHLWQSLVKAQLQFVRSHFASTPIGQLYKHSCPFTFTDLARESRAAEVSSLYPAVRGLRFTQPVAGQQFFGERIDVPVELTLHTVKNALWDLGDEESLIRICLSMNHQLIRCVKLFTGPLTLQNVQTGHHLLTAHVCRVQTSCSKATRIESKEDGSVCCFNGGEGVTSFTANFHGVTVA